MMLVILVSLLSLVHSRAPLLYGAGDLVAFLKDLAIVGLVNQNPFYI